MIQTSKKQVIELAKQLHATKMGINVYDYSNNLNSYMNDLYEQSDYEKNVTYTTIAFSNNGYGCTSRLDCILIFECGEWHNTGICAYFE